LRKNSTSVPDSDRPRSCRAHPPLSDVGMMPAPVGHLPAGIVEDPTIIDVASGRSIWRLRRGAEPHVIIESVRYGLRIFAVSGAAEIDAAAGHTATYGLQLG